MTRMIHLDAEPTPTTPDVPNAAALRARYKATKTTDGTSVQRELDLSVPGQASRRQIGYLTGLCRKAGWEVPFVGNASSGIVSRGPRPEQRELPDRGHHVLQVGLLPRHPSLRCAQAHRSDRHPHRSGSAHGQGLQGSQRNSHASRLRPARWQGVSAQGCIQAGRPARSTRLLVLRIRP